MNRTLFVSRIVPFSVPLLLMVFIIFLPRTTLFSSNPSRVSLGITLDLLLTVPLLYFLLIRKTTIPRITVFPLFIIGIVVSSIILPREHQQLLEVIKTWVLPVVELGMIGMLVYQVRRALREVGDRNQVNDFFTITKSVCRKLMPNRVAIFIASELAVLYYGFVRWRNHHLTENEFTCHKNTGTIGLLSALIFLVIAEATIFHFLIARWSIVAAWILTGASIYTGIQILGFTKSIAQRPIVLTSESLILRFGILNEVEISRDQIESIEFSSRELPPNAACNLSFFHKFEGHNVIINVKTEHTLQGVYGINQTFKQLTISIDNKDEFQRKLEQ